jgi:eukaryotic-like serine/threonine-protein kinase
MTSFPAAGDYYKAVQAPDRVFTVPELRQAEFVWDALGPTLARGSSAVVFQAAVDGSQQALRCYIRNDASSRERYSALGDFLAGHDLDPFVSAVTWTDSAIRVKGATWPVLQMPWIDGRTLNEYVDFLVAGSNADALATLAVKWRELIALLQGIDFAHGDLQHGNVLVDQEGTLRLVDFDGIWIPQLAGMAPPTEYGHPNYQHPTQRVWDRWLDTFSALVIYLSLVALGKEPGLWLALYNSKNLLFSRPDLHPPFQTQAWKQLAALRDPQVDELTRLLRECCDPSWVSTGSLEALLDRRPAAPPTRRPPAPPPVPSAPPPQPAELRWWERPPPVLSGPRRPEDTAAQRPEDTTALPAPPPLSAPLGTAGTGPMTQLRRTMAPAGSTWWAAAQGQPPPPPGSWLRQGPVPAAAVLGVGVVILALGAAISQPVLVFVGLALAAGGIYWLVARTGG